MSDHARLLRDRLYTNALRINPVPIPQAPFINSAVNISGACQPPPMGLPFKGSTTTRATREGRIAPNRKAVIQYPEWRGNLLSTSANIIPQTPPHAEREKTAGTPKGGVAAIEKGPKGATPAAQSAASVN